VRPVWWIIDQQCSHYLPKDSRKKLLEQMLPKLKVCTNDTKRKRHMPEA